MNITIRPAQAEDMAFVLALNETNVEVLSPMDEARFAYFMQVSDLFQIAEVDGKPAAFLIAVPLAILGEGHLAVLYGIYIYALPLITLIGKGLQRKEKV